MPGRLLRCAALAGLWMAAWPGHSQPAQRIALVVGNAAYAFAPVETAVRDASAIADVLRKLSFTVFELHDATKEQLEASLTEISAAMRQPGSAGVFFYSGHALQRQWQNFLIPVDARPGEPGDITQRAVDVKKVVAAFGKEGSLNIFVFDACRENPFGSSASGRGLAQMDAPPDSLLVYSAAPGEVATGAVAADGHSLYVHHLLRELQMPTAKAEDVFKRVRFAVRRQSQGRQVPWENTSLESDFHFELSEGKSARLDPGPAASAGTAPVDSKIPREADTDQLLSDFMAGRTRFVGKFSVNQTTWVISGSGTVTWPDGGRFEGTLVEGRREGRGAYFWPSGQRYAGLWRDDQPSGEGVMWFANGDHFEGEFTAGMPNGQGRLRFESGDRFVGQVTNGRPHGQGVYTWPNGQSAAGQWANGNLNGPVVMRFANGDLFEGVLLNGQPDGAGRMVFASGETYVGSFAAGRPEGDGVYTWTDGARYAGRWKQGAKDGPGVMTWPNGDRWEGISRLNAMSEGTLIRADR